MPRPPLYVLDRAATRAVDRAAVEEYGLPGIVLMENAARALAAAAVAEIGDGGRAFVVAGGGNNGGDGWALARHLDNAGYAVTMIPAGEPRPGGDAAINAAVVRRMSIAEAGIDALDDARPGDLVVDALFGTGLDRPVAGTAADIVACINEAPIPVLAVDVPSGLDADRGEPLGPCVRATVTVTFVGLKPGFLREGADAWTGRVVVGDIGAPRALVERFGRPAPKR